MFQTTCIYFFFNDTATTEIYTLSLHDALPISEPPSRLIVRPLWRRDLGELPVRGLCSDAYARRCLRGQIRTAGSREPLSCTQESGLHSHVGARDEGPTLHLAVLEGDHPPAGAYLRLLPQPESRLPLGRP